MKRFYAILLVLAMLFSLAACGGNEDDKKPSSSDTPPSSGQQTQQPSNTPAPTPAADEPGGGEVESDEEENLIAALEKLGYTPEDIMPEEGVQDYHVFRHSEVYEDMEYNCDIRFDVEKQTIEQVFALYQKIAEKSRTLSDDGENHQINDFDTVQEDGTLEDFKMAVNKSAKWCYKRDGKLFELSFWYGPDTKGNYSYKIEFYEDKD